MISGFFGQGEKLVAVGFLGENFVRAPDVLHLEDLVSRRDVGRIELVKLRDIVQNLGDILLEGATLVGAESKIRQIREMRDGGLIYFHTLYIILQG